LLAVLDTGVLAAPIGVVDKARARRASLDSLLEGLLDQAGFEMVGRSPAEDFAAIEVHDGGQIEPALDGKDVSNVADPDPVGGGDWWGLNQMVLGDGQAVTRVGSFGSEGAFLAGFEFEGLHMASDAIAAARNTRALQTNRQARAAIGSAILDKEAGELIAEDLVLPGTSAGWAMGPGVVGAARDLEDLAQSANGIE
jgi:hypothetical protein